MTICLIDSEPNTKANVNKRPDITLVTHHAESWRRRAASTINQVGMETVTAVDWSEWSSLTDPANIACVVLGIPPSKDETELLLATARSYFPSARLIAVMPHHDHELTLAVLRAGAYSCVTQSALSAELVSHVRNAICAQVDPDGLPVASLRTVPRKLIAHRHQFLQALKSTYRSCHLRQCPLVVVKLSLSCEHLPGAPAGIDSDALIFMKWRQEIAQVFQTTELIAESGPNRILIALPDSRAPHAVALLKQCREKLAQDIPDHSISGVHLSAGVVQSSDTLSETQTQLLRRARIALDQAKRIGKNETVVWNDLVDHPKRKVTPPKASASPGSHWSGTAHKSHHPLEIESTRALIAAVEAKDPYTRAHSVTVARYAQAIADRLALPSEMTFAIHSAALLHDVGKIGVPDAILTKPGPLTEGEYTVVKRHPETALDILSHFSFLADERSIILHHHERFDGDGYPAGLSGQQIPIGARIVAVADALDTMLSLRSYKKPLSIQEARKELSSAAGKQFDPMVVNATLAWLDENLDMFKPTVVPSPTSSIADATVGADSTR